MIDYLLGGLGVALLVAVLWIVYLAIELLNARRELRKLEMRNAMQATELGDMHEKLRDLRVANKERVEAAKLERRCEELHPTSECRCDLDRSHTSPHQGVAELSTPGTPHVWRKTLYWTTPKGTLA